MSLSPPPAVPETATERTTRHLGICRRLAELGMTLVEAAAEEARHALAPDPTQTPAQAAAAMRAHINAATRFARLAGSVRQAIAMEQRILATQAVAAAPRHPDVPVDLLDHPAARALQRALEVRRDAAEAEDAVRNNRAPKSLPKTQLFETTTNVKSHLVRNTELDCPLWPPLQKTR